MERRSVNMAITMISTFIIGSILMVFAMKAIMGIEAKAANLAGQLNSRYESIELMLDELENNP